MKTISDVKLSYLVKAIVNLISGKSDSDHTHKFSDTQRIGGIASKAAKLENPRSIHVDLSSKGWVSFDGTRDIKPGVDGVLPLTHGGTGVSSIDELKSSLNLLKVYCDEYDGTANEQEVTSDTKTITVENMTEVLMLVVQPKNNRTKNLTLTAIKGLEQIGIDANSGSTESGRNITFDGNKVSIYDSRGTGSSNKLYNFNSLGETYVYLAIGY